jgi:hypothetical protein
VFALDPDELGAFVAQSTERRAPGAGVGEDVSAVPESVSYAFNSLLSPFECEVSSLLSEFPQMGFKWRVEWRL